MLGYFVVLVAGHMHREWDSVFVGELVDGIRYLGCTIGFLRRLEAALLAQVEVVEIVGGVDNRCRTYVAAVIVDEDVAHYGEDPALEVGVLRVLLLVVESLQSSILQQVVCVVPVGSQHIGEIQQIGLEGHQVDLKFCTCHNVNF